MELKYKERSNRLATVVLPKVIESPVIPPGVKEYSIKNNLTARTVKNEETAKYIISL